MRRRGPGWFGAAVTALACSVSAAADQVDYATAIPVWQAHEARMLAIGWRLMRANAPLCRQHPPAVGLMLYDLRELKDADRARAALGIESNDVVEAVAPGSPAEQAGLRAGDEVLAIAGGSTAEMASPSGRGSSQVDALYNTIDRQLGASGHVALRVKPRGQAPRDVTIAGVPACRARLAMLHAGSIAGTRGLTIEIAVQLLAETPDDDEAATMLAHELAHNIFGHWQHTLQTGKNNYVAIRDREREADRMAPWLMANAGYDPAAAPRFFARWGPRHSGGMTRAPTHDSWQDRVAMVGAELSAIAAAHRPGAVPPVDWRSRFPGPQAD